MKKILIFYEYFLPAYKAGGPIQSIANLLKNSMEDYKFYIVCGDTDHCETKTLSGIEPDKWNDFDCGNASVYYLSGKHRTKMYIKSLITSVAPDLIFINGLYSIPFSVIPVWISTYKTVLSVRGMLHPGALAQKRWKKIPFLFLFRLLRLHKKVVFHATDEKEQQQVMNVFGKNVQTMIAGNYPKVNDFIPTPEKCLQTELVLGSVGLISPMKNHLLVLKALLNCKNKIHYQIYGAIKDKNYWEQCLHVIQRLPVNIRVTYGGEVLPSLVEEKIKEFHYFILPSKSENFGHAFFEALSAGRPVITSNYTPWNNLLENKAGINVDISDIKSISDAIVFAARQTAEEFNEWSLAARNFALGKVDFTDIKDQYRKLFSTLDYRKKKTFDTVNFFRAIKEKLATKIEGMTLEQQKEFLRQVRERKIKIE